MIHTVKKGETITSIAIDYRIPVQTLLSVNNLANPNIIFIGQQINIPGLPEPATIPYEIHVSIASRRLTLISQGKILTLTPIGDYVIVNREPNPGGPFGAMWLSLSKIHYGIHGTNDPSSIGKAVSLGCIRMYNQDVIELASLVPNGTRVIIRPS
ncbi:L,D-transpeptidase family protein [Metabacillus fastidiosus]|uniref:L,D-transpeptidase family protein n=1 Tax=Metabacillus fastidiosus TaxID=1458 RepID=UPI002E20BDF4|nr:LysM peptidoglycan-binding domain-containing protein [Metabacillus fastidiosus]